MSPEHTAMAPDLDALCAWGERFWQRGWLPAGSGNFSLRRAGGGAMVTASGRHKGQLRPADFLLLDGDGVVEGAGRASAEAGLHLERYRADPSIGCVLHTHSVSATLLSRREDQAVVLADFELAKAFADVDSHRHRLVLPIFDNDQDIARLAAQVSQREAREPIREAYLIRGHGLYVWGADVETAARRVEAMEFLLECAWKEAQ